MTARIYRDPPEPMTVFVLDCTSWEGPEQYDVYDATTREKVGYLHLHGQYFYATLSEPDGRRAYSATPAGINRFAHEGEQEHYLGDALYSIYRTKYQKEPPPMFDGPLYRIESSVYTNSLPELWSHSIESDLASLRFDGEEEA
jgi:hypothetical protein